MGLTSFYALCNSWSRDGKERVSVSEVGAGEKPEGFSPSDFWPKISVPEKGEYPKEL